MRNLKSVRRTPLARSYRFVLAALLFLCAHSPDSMVHALHEVDHRFTVQGRICGESGEGIGAVVVSVKDTRADVSGKGKTDSDGFYEITLHLHDENQGDPLLVQSGEYEATGRVELDPNDRTTERITSINLGKPCPPIPFWRKAWFVGGGLVLFGIVILIGLRAKKRKRLDGDRKGKGRKR